MSAPKKGDQFSPPLTEDERLVFLRFKEDRVKSDYEPRIQKRQAIELLALHRPTLHRTFNYKIEGMEVRQIAKKMGCTPLTVRIRSQAALRWIQLAIFGQVVESSNAQ